MSDDALIEAVAKAMSESGNKDWMYAEDWFKDIYIGQAIAALAVCRAIIEAPLRAENEKLRAALCGVTSELEQFVQIFKGYQGMTMSNAQAALRAAAAALKETDNV